MPYLERYQSLCRAIARLLPGQVEVVLHDLVNNRIALIENSFSPRAAGDDSLVETANYRAELQTDDTIGPYLKSSPDGARLRTVSALIRDDAGNPMGLLCLNLRMTELEAARDVLAALTAVDGKQDSDMLRNDWREMANAIIASTLREMQRTFNQVRRAERLVIVQRLAEADIFSARGAANYVAEALGISRANLYDLIRQAKQPPASAEQTGDH